MDKVEKVNEAIHEEEKALKGLNETTSLSQSKKNEALELLTNDIIVDKGKEHEHFYAAKL